jgi:murein DD-endopeptidase MepM/ murein hydrolase activator NlpD
MRNYLLMAGSVAGMAFVALFGLFLSVAAAAVKPVSVVVSPASVMQGEPMLVTVRGATRAAVKSISFSGVPLGVFTYRNIPAALAGIDLNKAPGTYTVSVKLSDGRTLQRDITVAERKKVTAPLGIPQKLGGNTAASQDALVTTLAAENKSLATAHTATTTLWTEKFRFPLKDITVTDAYGYLRQTGPYSIPHKGVDLRAAEGTRVTAINRGVVRLAKEYRNYGKTVVVDHGLGLLSFYMHLSKIRVNVGELVKPGQLVGLSGQTGYAEEPHLHLTVRVGGTSIDPMQFFKLFD